MLLLSTCLMYMYTIQTINIIYRLLIIFIISNHVINICKKVNKN